MVVPLPTVIEEGNDGRRERSIPSDDDICEVALESSTHGITPWTNICCRAAISLAGSQDGVGEEN